MIILNICNKFTDICSGFKWCFQSKLISHCHGIFVPLVPWNISASSGINFTRFFLLFIAPEAPRCFYKKHGSKYCKNCIVNIVKQFFAITSTSRVIIVDCARQTLSLLINALRCHHSVLQPEIWHTFRAAIDSVPINNATTLF